MILILQFYLDVHNWVAVCMVNKGFRSFLVHSDSSNLVIFLRVSQMKRIFIPHDCSLLERPHTDTQCCTLAEWPFSWCAQEKQWSQWIEARNNLSSKNRIFFKLAAIINVSNASGTVGLNNLTDNDSLNKLIFSMVQMAQNIKKV